MNVIDPLSYNYMFFLFRLVARHKLVVVRLRRLLIVLEKLFCKH